MPTSKTQPMTSKDEIVRSLKERAAQLWGRDRAEAIAPTIAETAQNVWQLSQDLPDAHEEPGFYF